WEETRMRHLVNDRWRAVVTAHEIGHHEFRLIAWRDLFASWRAEMEKKHAAGQKVSLELEEGRRLIEKALAARVGPSADRAALKVLLREAAASGVETDIIAVLMSEDM